MKPEPAIYLEALRRLGCVASEDPEKAPLMKEVLTWVFHGAKDEAVPLQKSQEMVGALKATGGDVRFTVYPEGGHVEVWQNAYSDPALWAWLAKQRQAE